VPQFTVDAALMELSARGMRWAIKDLAPTEQKNVFETFAVFCSKFLRSLLFLLAGPESGLLVRPDSAEFGNFRMKSGSDDGISTKSLNSARHYKTT
jgi:hypothetical protein